MDQDCLKTASAMLCALIAGESCEHIGHQHGVTKSFVSQRVRGLARDLQQIVGVVGVEEEESPTAGLIRQNGEAYLEALQHFAPEAAPALRGRDLRLVSEHIDLYIAKITRHSRCARRDTALLLTLFSTAAKPLEIAQMEVRDYLEESGCVRAQSMVRAEIAMNHVARNLYFQAPATNAAIDAYLCERVVLGIGTSAGSSFRGLQPHSSLFLSRSGTAMKMKKSGVGGRHLVCKEIHEIYRRIFSYGGLPGVNTALARRMAAHALRDSGANAEEIGLALGLRKLAVHKLLQTGPAFAARSA